MELSEVENSNFLSSSTFDYWLDFPSEPRSETRISEALFEEPLKKDLWSFGFFWFEVLQKFSTVEQLYAAIQDLHGTIREIKEKYRPLCVDFPDKILEPNIYRGVSGSYFLVDEAGKPHYVVKPLDEDAGCIHSEGFATPLTSSPLRSNIELYRSAMREVLAYQVALSIGVGGIIPKTELSILESEKFHDFSEGVSLEEIKRYLDTCESADKEKLCSVQEYVQDAKSLFEAVEDLQMAGLTDDEIMARFDQTDFEEANLLLWTIYDTDGHAGNFLVYPKGTDAIGNEILGLKKIDNGLAFPAKNQQLRNNLSYLPNAHRELSEQAKAKISAIDVDHLAKQFEQMGLEGSIPALRERIPMLKELAAKPAMTIKEINKAMTKIGKKR